MNFLAALQFTFNLSPACFVRKDRNTFMLPQGYVGSSGAKVECECKHCDLMVHINENADGLFEYTAHFACGNPVLTLRPVLFSLRCHAKFCEDDHTTEKRMIVASENLFDLVDVTDEVFASKFDIETQFHETMRVLPQEFHVTYTDLVKKFANITASRQELGRKRRLKPNTLTTEQAMQFFISRYYRFGDTHVISSMGTVVSAKELVQAHNLIGPFIWHSRMEGGVRKYYPFNAVNQFVREYVSKIMPLRVECNRRNTPFGWQLGIFNFYNTVPCKETSSTDIPVEMADALAVIAKADAGASSSPIYTFALGVENPQFDGIFYSMCKIAVALFGVCNVTILETVTQARDYIAKRRPSFLVISRDINLQKINPVILDDPTHFMMLDHEKIRTKKTDHKMFAKYLLNGNDRNECDAPSEEEVLRDGMFCHAAKAELEYTCSRQGSLLCTATFAENWYKMHHSLQLQGDKLLKKLSEVYPGTESLGRKIVCYNDSDGKRKSKKVRLFKLI